MSKPTAGAEAPDYLAVVHDWVRMRTAADKAIEDALDAARIEGLNAVQCRLLAGMADGQDVGTVLKVAYIGSNVSYNVRKLVELGYLNQTRSEHDRRSTKLTRTDKGNAIVALVHETLARVVPQILAANSNTKRSAAA